MPGGKLRLEPGWAGSPPPGGGALVLAAGAAPTVVQGEVEVEVVREAPMSLAAAPWPGARSLLASCWVALAFAPAGVSVVEA